MRYSVAHFRASAVCVCIALAGTSLSGCGQLSPSGGAEALKLLKAGSEKVCTDPSVQSTLRSILLPKPDDIQTGSSDDKRKAFDAVSFSYSTTTLDSFDKTTSKASCDTTLEVQGPANSSNKFHLIYTISPSADDPTSTVVATTADDARAYILNLVVSGLPADLPTSEDVNAMEGDDQPPAPTVDEASLVGIWIKTRQPGASCHSSSAVAFQPDHVITGGLGKGRWALTANTLHLVTDASRTADVTANILAADAISMTLGMPGNSRLTLRRCSSEELQTPAPSDDSGNGATTAASGAAQ